MEHFCTMAPWLGKTNDFLQILKKDNRTIIINTTVFVLIFIKSQREKMNDER